MNKQTQLVDMAFAKTLVDSALTAAVLANNTVAPSKARYHISMALDHLQEAQRLTNNELYDRMDNI